MNASAIGSLAPASNSPRETPQHLPAHVENHREWRQLYERTVCHVGTTQPKSALERTGFNSLNRLVARGIREDFRYPIYPPFSHGGGRRDRIVGLLCIERTWTFIRLTLLCAIACPLFDPPFEELYLLSVQLRVV